MASEARSEIKEYGGLQNIDLLIDQIDKLVSLPDVYYRLEALAEKPNSTLDDFAHVLSSEPDLCARLLSLANSAFYSFPASIESVEKAVQVIGTRQIRELVLATSIINAFSQVPMSMVNMRTFWEHSVAVGVFAKSIGQYCHLTQPERFYVSGLLHDLGRLIFYIKLPGMMHDLLIEREASQQYLFALELETLAYTHGEAGGQLLKKWRVPQSIYEPVMYHHSPAGSSDFSPVTAAIHVADVWVNKHQMGSSGERFELPFDAFALEQLNLQIFELDEIWAMAQVEIREVFNKFVPQ